MLHVFFRAFIMLMTSSVVKGCVRKESGERRARSLVAYGVVLSCLSVEAVVDCPLGGMVAVIILVY